MQLSDLPPRDFAGSRYPHITDTGAAFERRIIILEQRVAKLEEEAFRADVRRAFSQAKTEMVRWMSGFWVATVGMIFLARLI